MVKKRYMIATNTFICALLLFSLITMFTMPAKEVEAATIGVRVNVYSSDSGQITGSFERFSGAENTSATFVIYLNKPVEIVGTPSGVEITSNSGGTIRGTISDWGSYCNKFNHGYWISIKNVEGDTLDGLVCNSASTSEITNTPATTAPTTTTTTAATTTTITPAHTHSYGSADCTHAATCSCGATNGSALGHDYGNNRQICSRCGNPNPNYQAPHTHSYSAADCTHAATCSCGATNGSALGHDYGNNNQTCSRCGNPNPNYQAPDQADAIVPETPETTIETTVEETEVTEELPPDGEEVAPESDDQIVEGDDDSATPDDGEGDGTPTPTRRTAVGGVIRKDNSDGAKKAFPWWILIVLAILGAAGYRYRQLSNENYSGMELVCEFIPGGVIGNVVDKVAPNLRKPATPATPKEDEPVVVNGYLKTSNTKSIRPVYSNAPQTRGTRGVTSTATKAVTPVTPVATKAPIAAKTAAATTAAPKKPVQQRPPVKRPASLSSNKAVAEAAKAEAASKTPVANEVTVAEARAKAEAARVEANKAEAEAAAIAAGKVVEKTVEKKAEPKTAPAANKVPLQQRPPIKRPASLSSNRAAVAAAAKGATATPEQVKASAKPSPFEGKKVAESKPVQQRPPVKRPSSATQRPMVKRPTGAATAAAAAKAADTSKENKQTGIKASGTPDSYFIPMKNPEQQEKINPFKAIDNNPSASDEN